MDYLLRHSARPALLGCLLLATTGCSAVRHHTLQGPTPTAPAAGSPPALLIVLDGLRADVFERYVAALGEADYEPDWPSGIALLGRAGFQLALSTRAEGPVPASGVVADAVIATGQGPIHTGLPGRTFYDLQPGASPIRVDFGDALDASRIHFQLGGGLPTGGSLAANWPMASNRLIPRTLYERLAPTHRSTVVFHSFAKGAQWRAPTSRGAAVSALLDWQTGAAAVPLFDRGARNAAIAALVEGPAPDVLTVYFRGIFAGSCFQVNALCGGEDSDLQSIQQLELRRIDAELMRLLSKYRRAHPDVFKRLTVLLTGTTGLVDRGSGSRPDMQSVLRSTQVAGKLAAHSTDPECAQWLRSAPRRRDLLFAAHDATLHLYLPREPTGQQHKRHERLRCLAGAVENLLKDDDGFASGAVWRDPAQPAPVAALLPSFRRGLPAHRRQRTLAKLRGALDQGAKTRSGDVVLFARGRWIFREDDDARPIPFAARGSLSGAAMRIPFLVASPFLTSEAATALRSIPVELADIAPTILAIVQAPAEASLDLPRPSVLQWRGERLEINRADRAITHETELGSVQFSTTELADGLEISALEAGSVWPPDELDLRVGDTTWRFDPDTGAFPQGAPCTFTESKQQRRWACTAPLDRAEPRIIVAAGHRRPAGDETDDEEEREARFIQSVVLGQSSPEFTAPPTAICADAEGIELQLSARDPLGLDRLELTIVDGRGNGLRGRFRDGLLLAHPITKLAQSPGCAASVTAADCTFGGVQTEWTARVRLPLTKALFDQIDLAEDLTPGKADGDAIAEAYRSLGGAGVPSRAPFIAVQICNIAGRCRQRAVATYAAYRALLKSGCQ